MRRGANILVVDGNPAGRGELTRAARALGHTVIGEAESGAQALVLARSLHPDLVLLDLGVGSPPALEVARVLTEEQVAPTLLLSDQDPTPVVEPLEASGAMGFFARPLREVEIGPAIPITVARWRRILDLEAEVRSLNERMEARKLVGRAKAILMERHNLPEREAFRRIQAQSISLGKPVHEIARAIITASEIPAA